MLIIAYNYNIIGCSSNWEQNNASFALFNRIKAFAPGIVTIMGGSNCEGEMAEGIALACRNIDYIFSGEAEVSFKDFLDNYSKGLPMDNRIITSTPVQNLNAIPLAEPESFKRQYNQFIGTREQTDWAVSYESSRGCYWGNCTFCGMNGKNRKKFRKKDPKKVIRELEHLYKKNPERLFSMIDKVMPKEYKEEFLPLLEKKEMFSPLWYEQRSDLSFKELVQLFKARVTSIQPGIEALSDGLLKLMRKGISVAHNILLLRHARCLNLYMKWNLLWGFPGEKKEYYEETLALLPLLCHFQPPLVFRHLSIDRFSPYYNTPGNFGISNLRPWEAYKGVYPGDACISKLAYRFIGDYSSCLDGESGLIHRIAGELDVWKKRWKNTYLAMKPIMGAYAIFDNRDNPEKPATHILEAEQAREIMVSGPYNGNLHQKWAVERNLAVVSGTTYVPLVTAPPKLLLEFGQK